MARFDYVVVGGGLAGLLAAYEASSKGKTVALFEANKHCGGAVASVEISGMKIDSGAESFAITRPETLALVEELGLSDLLVTPARSDARIFHHGQSFVIPHGLMGIPSDLNDPQTIAILGLDVANRAIELDSVPWNITDEKTLGDVVAKRMGSEVVERIVNPIVSGVHASDSYLLEMESLLPGLVAKARELNSLHLAVRQMRGNASRPGSAVAGINGGINLLTRKLFSILKARGVVITSNSPVEGISFNGHWRVEVNNEYFESDNLVVATNPAVASHLLTDFAELADLLKQIISIDVALVILAVKAPELAARPLGSGVLIADKSSNIEAKASTHITAKWQWISDLAGSELDLIRLSYGRNGIVDPSDENLLKTARNDLATIYGLSDPVIIDSVVMRWPKSLVQARIGHQDNVRKIRETLLRYPGLTIVGSGVSGNGIAGVISRTRVDMKGLINV